jgi:3-hydroxy acid dehydrogenase/malonic semialdehyde reductase
MKMTHGRTKKDGAKESALVAWASNGVGAATALALARVGFNLALTPARRQNLERSSAESAVAGAEVLPVELELPSQASIEAAVFDLRS